MQRKIIGTATSFTGPAAIVSSPKNVEVGRAGPMKPEEVAGMPTRLAATSITKRWTSPTLLGHGWSPELDPEFDDAIIDGVAEKIDARS